MILPNSYERHEVAIQRAARGSSAASAIPATSPKQYPPIDRSSALVFNLPPGAFFAPVMSAPDWLSGTPSFEILVRGTTTTNSIFYLYKNGDPVSTMTVHYGTDVRMQFSPDVHFVIDDILEVLLDTAGAGGTAATVKLF